MTINYDQKNNSISILTARSSYQLKIGRYGHLLHLLHGHGGHSLPQRLRQFQLFLLPILI